MIKWLILTSGESPSPHPFVIIKPKVELLEKLESHVEK